MINGQQIAQRAADSSEETVIIGAKVSRDGTVIIGAADSSEGTVIIGHQIAVREQ